jgi:hypothetical protein
LLADYETANPAPGSYPVWRAMSLPATTTNGDLSVSLVSLASGSRILDWAGGSPRAFTKAVFRVSRRGNQTTSWSPYRMDAMDATGNEFSPEFQRSGATNGLVFNESQLASLSPGEVWRLKLKFHQVGEFSGEQLWASPDMPVIKGIIQPASLTARFRGCDSTVHVKFSSYSVTVRIDRLPAGRRLVAARIFDARGVELQPRPQGHSRDDEVETFPAVEAGVQSIRVSVALGEIREFEFLARPTRE